MSKFSATVTKCINATLNIINMKRGGFNIEVQLILDASSAPLLFVEDVFFLNPVNLHAITVKD